MTTDLEVADRVLGLEKVDVMEFMGTGLDCGKQPSAFAIMMGSGYQSEQCM